MNCIMLGVILLVGLYLGGMASGRELRVEFVLMVLLILLGLGAILG